jgi:hypothetical protein
MSLSAQAKLAEVQERQVLLSALSLLMLGLIAGISALGYYYSPRENTWMFLLQVGVLLFSLLTLLVLLINTGLLAARVGLHKRRTVLEGFVQGANLRALGVSWCFTFFMAIVLAAWTDPGLPLFSRHVPAALFPAPFYFQFLICCMLLSYSLVCFAVYWLGSADDEKNAA